MPRSHPTDLMKLAEDGVSWRKTCLGCLRVRLLQFLFGLLNLQLASFSMCRVLEAEVAWRTVFCPNDLVSLTMQASLFDFSTVQPTVCILFYCVCCYKFNQNDFYFCWVLISANICSTFENQVNVVH